MLPWFQLNILLIKTLAAATSNLRKEQDIGTLQLLEVLEDGCIVLQDISSSVLLSSPIN
jgi:hypothetical protein